MIELTSAMTGKPIYVNPKNIGHMYSNESGFTVLGVSTHNNGGFLIGESPELIIKLINKN